MDCEVETLTSFLIEQIKRRNCLMKLIALALMCVALALVVSACTETATPTNTNTSHAAASPAASVDEFASARANYAKNCEACHGADATGGPVKADDKTIKVPSLNAEHALKHTDDQITKMITNGEEAMPAS